MNYTKEQLIDALCNEYEYLCHDDYDPVQDPTPEEYQAHLEYYEYDELVEETATDEYFTLEEYMLTYGTLCENTK